MRIKDLRERLDDAIVTARRNATQMRRVAPNSYDDGYDSGFLDALLRVLNTVNGEDEETL
jgi:hypothetical protein